MLANDRTIEILDHHRKKMKIRKQLMSLTLYKRLQLIIYPRNTDRTFSLSISQAYNNNNITLTPI